MKTSSKSLQFPYSKVVPRPSITNPDMQAFADKELGCEGFTYILKSGELGTVHIEQALEYNQDPGYLRDTLVALTLMVVESRPAQKDSILKMMPCMLGDWSLTKAMQCQI